jgi:hypothetical protein
VIWAKIRCSNLGLQDRCVCVGRWVDGLVVRWVDGKRAVKWKVEQGGEGGREVRHQRDRLQDA